MKIVNEKEFDEIIKDGFTLVDFYADWCGPCKMLAPILEALDNEYPDITFIKVNCDDEMGLAERYGIMSIPAVFLFKDGNLIGQTGGYRGKDEMNNFIKNNISK